MDLYEYQAKHLFGKHHVPVVPGAVCETPDAARLAAREMRQRLSGVVAERWNVPPDDIVFEGGEVHVGIDQCCA